MTAPSLLVSVADLEREEQISREWELSPSWLGWALEGSDATSTGEPGLLSATLVKNGRQVLVRGRIRARVALPCARTLDPAVYDLAPDLVLILSKREDPAAKGQRPSRRARREEAPPPQEEVSADSYSGDQVVLDDFVREQLLLELPMFPLRSDLRLDDAPAIPAPPEEPKTGSTIDPRLLPLKALAEKLDPTK